MIETIYGPPGCGKTTELLNVLDAELSLGTPPAAIAFVSFTKRAVGEALERVGARFGFGQEEAPWFRTLHSAAFRMLGLSRDDVMGDKHWRDFGMGIGYTFTAQDPTDPIQRTRGDAVLAVYQYARATGLPLIEALHRSGDIGVEAWELRRFVNELRLYKSSLGLVEFSDMLEATGTTNCEVVIVDEAQDLSREQWAFADRAFLRGAQRVFLAGDDDQAVFGWSGADVEEFQRRGDRRRVLSQSWRVPSRVHKLAGRIAGRIRKRVQKEWLPRSEQGSVRRVGYLDALDILESEGSWLLLARNAYLLDQYKQHLRHEGILWEGSVRKHHAQAIAQWERMRKGQESDVSLALEWSRQFDEVPEAMPPWFEALDRIPLADREYYRAAMRRGQRLLQPPRVRISTMHGAKGAEADHVVVLSDMAQRSYQERDSDEEQRVWYVGATRARQALYIVDPASMYSFMWS